MPWFDVPAAISSNTWPLSRRQPVERVVVMPSLEQRGDDGGTDGRAAGGDPSDRADEVRHVADPVHEQSRNG
jgi:hypothetical protein